MGKRYVKNGKKVNRHGIPIGMDIEEIVDKAERKERKEEKEKTKRASFVESIKTESDKVPESEPEIKYVPESKYIKPYRKMIEKVFARKVAQRADEAKKAELLKVIAKIQEKKEDKEER